MTAPRPAHVRRSGLFVPVVVEKFVQTAWTRGADLVILDLEDSVPPHKKAEARGRVATAVPIVSRGGADVAVRINHDTALEDLEAALVPGVSSIMYPKAEHASEIRVLDDAMTRLERERDIPVGTVELSPAIESPLGVVNVAEIAAASPRIRGVGGGGGLDMARSMGVDQFPAVDQFVYPKSEIELLARAAGHATRSGPFLGPTTFLIDDDELAYRSALASFECGVHGTIALHPALVAAQIRGFTPSDAAQADARRVLDEYARLPVDRSWAVVDGRVVDRYEARRAEQLLEWAEQCRQKDAAKAAAVERASAHDVAPTGGST